MNQIIQLFGALCILAAFISAQFRLLDQRSYTYLALNAIGSGILAVLAARDAQWGFLLLEGVWAGISLLGLVTRRQERPARISERGRYSCTSKG